MEVSTEQMYWKCDASPPYTSKNTKSEQLQQNPAFALELNCPIYSKRSTEQGMMQPKCRILRSGFTCRNGRQMHYNLDRDNYLTKLAIKAITRLPQSKNHIRCIWFLWPSHKEPYLGIYSQWQQYIPHTKAGKGKYSLMVCLSSVLLYRHSLSVYTIYWVPRGGCWGNSMRW